MARPIEENKNVVQSYMLTAARYDFSVYEKRILYRLVELAQAELQGKDFVEWIGMKVETNLFGDKDITMPVRCILANEEDNNYAKAKKAFKAMSSRTIEQTKGKCLVSRPHAGESKGKFGYWSSKIPCIS